MPKEYHFFTMKVSKTKRNTSYVPGFWDGFASIFGAAVPVEGEKVSDKDAMCSDWENVGNDLRKAMSKIALQ